MKRKSNYAIYLCCINFRKLIKGIKMNSVLTLLLVFSSFVFVSISANTAYTGIRNITSMQLTADMGAGWNLGNSLDAHGNWVSGLDTETCWGNPKTTRAMIDAIKQKGFKTIRIPVTWYQHLGSAPNYTIDSEWLDRIEEVINYAFANDMYVITNIHHDDSWIVPTYAKKDAVIAQLEKVWTQIANRFKDYGDYLIFETLNEPRLVGSNEEWSGGTAEGRDVVNSFHLGAVNAIRNTGGNNANRHIMISTYGANGSEDAINDLVIPNNDTRIIVSWHNYSPYNFVLKIPGTTTWGTDSEKAELNALFDRIYNKFIANGRAVVMGEFSPTDKNNTNERVKYTEFMVKAAKARKIVPVWWDNGDIKGSDSDGGSAIFNRKTVTWLYPTIADAIINNIGSCDPTTITPYIQVNDGSWSKTSSATINSGDKVKFGPQPNSGGSWSWSGCGTSGTSREQTVYPTSSCTATATYTNSCGTKSTQSFNITVNSNGGSSITVRARGTQGSESISLSVGGSTVKTWTLTTSLADYTTSTSNTGNIQVKFTNDGGSRDVQVDYIIVDGTTYQAEDQSTNTGVWQNNSCGGSNSEWLHCNGYIEFPASSDYNITIRARGTNGSENIKLTVGGSTVKTWTLTTSMADYSTSTSNSGSINVEFTNDAGGRDVQVDYIIVSGTTHQAENQSTNTGVWQNNSCGGSNSEWLHCNGYIGFSAFKNAAGPQTVLESEYDLQIYPNPVYDVVNVHLSKNTSYISIYNLQGKRLFDLQSNNQKAEIDMSAYKSGIYFLKIISGEKETTEMLIKK